MKLHSFGMLLKKCIDKIPHECIKPYYFDISAFITQLMLKFKLSENFNLHLYHTIKIKIFTYVINEFHFIPIRFSINGFSGDLHISYEPFIGLNLLHYLKALFIYF